jgi:hypothetical protein
MDKLECSVWTNGRNGWGIRILGGTRVRREHFRQDLSPVVVEIHGLNHPFNIGKKRFWTRVCGELIGKPLREWKTRHGLKSGDHVWLKVLEPYRHFRLEGR